MSASTSTIRPSKPTRGHRPRTRRRHSTHRPHMGQRWCLTWHHHHTDRVQPDSRGLHVMLTHPYRRQLPQRLHLRKRDRLKRMAKTQPAAALHLTKDQRHSPLAALRGNNVDLPQPATPIPLQHLHALPLQLSTSQVLTPHTQLLLRLRLRHHTPPKKACGRQSESCRLTEICGKDRPKGCGKGRTKRPTRRVDSYEAERYSVAKTGLRGSDRGFALETASHPAARWARAKSRPALSDR